MTTIAVDSSSLSLALQGVTNEQTRRVRELALNRDLALPPVVVSEILSYPRLPDGMRDFVVQLDMLPIRDGYWERAGLLRADIRSRGLKAKLADCLIAQSCIDLRVPLITFDNDFRHFVRAGLTLA